MANREKYVCLPDCPFSTQYLKSMRREYQTQFIFGEAHEGGNRSAGTQRRHETRRGPFPATPVIDPKWLDMDYNGS